MAEENFLSSLSRSPLGFQPAQNGWTNEGNAGANGELDAEASYYQNKIQHLQFYEPTERGTVSLMTLPAGAAVQIPLYAFQERPFEYEVGLRFFGQVKPINEVLYGD